MIIYTCDCIYIYVYTSINICIYIYINIHTHFIRRVFSACLHHVSMLAMFRWLVRNPQRFPGLDPAAHSLEQYDQTLTQGAPVTWPWQSWDEWITFLVREFHAGKGWVAGGCWDDPTLRGWVATLIPYVNSTSKPKLWGRPDPKKNPGWIS